MQQQKDPGLGSMTGSMRPGQDLVAVGYAGLEGTRAIAKEKRTELLERFSEDYVSRIGNGGEEAEGNPELFGKLGATECVMMEEGGVLAALWNLSGAYHLGIDFELRRIPVRQETVEVCEQFGLNPYRLMSGGCFLLAADSGYRVVRELEKRGIPAAVIGSVTEGIKRIVDSGDGLGFLNKPERDELYKILPSWKREGKSSR